MKLMHAILITVLRIHVGSGWVANEEACGRQAVRGRRIVGGENSYRGEFPWLVSIRLNGQHYCGGTLLDHDTVLTAAHCMAGYLPENFLVRLGGFETRRLQPEEEAVETGAERILVHQNFSQPRPFTNDIALVKLRRRVEYSDYILPICLPPYANESLANEYEGVEGVVAGWGWVHDTATTTTSQRAPFRGSAAKVLQKVRLPVITNEECESWYAAQRRLVVLSPSQFCAGLPSGGKDSCRGDSGGPMLVKDEATGRYQVIGIVSAGIGCAMPKMAGLYTRVSGYIPWIQAHSAI